MAPARYFPWQGLIVAASAFAGITGDRTTVKLRRRTSKTPLRRTTTAASILQFMDTFAT